MMAVTDADYHLTFGLHSGIPLCCSIHFSDGGGKGGPCEKCAAEGKTHSDVIGNLHYCDERTPACQPYLDRVDINMLSNLQSWLDGGIKLIQEGIEDDGNRLTWGMSTIRVLSDEMRDLLKDNTFRMVHICWPGKTYHYIYVFQRGAAEPAKCDFCNAKFSLKFPTAGKQGK